MKRRAQEVQRRTEQIYGEWRLGSVRCPLCVQNFAELQGKGFRIGRAVGAAMTVIVGI